MQSQKTDLLFSSLYVMNNTLKSIYNNQLEKLREQYTTLKKERDELAAAAEASKAGVEE